MGINSTFLQETDPWFGFGALGDAARRFSPVVKNPGNVADPGVRLAQAQHELKVLHPIVVGIESILEREISFHAKEVPDIHYAAEIFRGPLRLEERLVKYPRAVVEFVFVGVDYFVTLT